MPEQLSNKNKCVFEYELSLIKKEEREEKKWENSIISKEEYDILYNIFLDRIKQYNEQNKRYSHLINYKGKYIINCIWDNCWKFEAYAISENIGD